MTHQPHEHAEINETRKRSDHLRELMNEAIRTLSPQRRDRRLQIHLAQARGPIANAELLRAAMNRAIRLHAAKTKRKTRGN